MATFTARLACAGPYAMSTVKSPKLEHVTLHWCTRTMKKHWKVLSEGSPGFSQQCSPWANSSRLIHWITLGQVNMFIELACPSPKDKPLIATECPQNTEDTERHFPKPGTAGRTLAHGFELIGSSAQR